MSFVGLRSSFFVKIDRQHVNPVIDQARGARRNCDSSMFPVGNLGMYPDFGVELLLLRAGESRRVPLADDRNH